MAIEERRWTITQVFSGLGLRYGYRLRGETIGSLANYRTADQATKAAARAWKQAAKDPS